MSNHDLVVRPSGLPPPKDWSLQFRQAHCGGTDYSTIKYIDYETACMIVDAGEPFFLFGDPRKEKP